jgi:hypothetical protein
MGREYTVEGTHMGTWWMQEDKTHSKEYDTTDDAKVVDGFVLCSTE